MGESITFSPEAKIEYSVFQSQFLTYVFALKAKRRNMSAPAASFALFLASSLHPWATRRHHPIEGMYKTRSATTKPTGKKRFDAGKKGKTRSARP